MKWWRQRRKVRLLIVYKTGFRMVVRCSAWKAETSRVDGRLLSLTVSDPQPCSPFLGIASVESVWRL